MRNYYSKCGQLFSHAEDRNIHERECRKCINKIEEEQQGKRNKSALAWLKLLKSNPQKIPEYTVEESKEEKEIFKNEH